VNADALTPGVDLLNLMADFNFDVLLLFKYRRRPGDQLLDIADNLADVIGNASGRIRSVGTAFISDDFKLCVPVPGTRCGAHACRISSDN
jgi:hypothetical protein